MFNCNIKRLISVLKQTDVFVPNESEINKIKNRLNMNNTFNKWILNNGTSYILEKKGSDGVKVWTSRESFYIPSYKVKSIDTSGAGDSFAGGLIYCLINNYSIKEAAAFSSACGAITTTFEGPHGVFTIDDITELMQNREEIL